MKRTAEARAQERALLQEAKNKAQAEKERKEKADHEHKDNKEQKQPVNVAPKQALAEAKQAEDEEEGSYSEDSESETKAEAPAPAFVIPDRPPPPLTNEKVGSVETCFVSLQLFVAIAGALSCFMVVMLCRCQLFFCDARPVCCPSCSRCVTLPFFFHVIYAE